MNKIICVDPYEDKVLKECDRYKCNRCCICPAPHIAVSVGLIKELISLLQLDGKGSKKVAATVLQDILNEELDHE